MYGWGVDDGSDELQVCTSDCQAGISGDAAGQFSLAGDIAVDSDGNIFVTEFGNNRVSSFASDGDFRFAFGWGVRTGAEQFEICTEDTGCRAGIYGDGAGQFAYPDSVAVDPQGRIYVNERNNPRIQRFAPDGSYLGVLDVGGHGGISIAPNGDVYYPEPDYDRVIKLNGSLEFVLTFGWGVLDGAEEYQVCQAASIHDCRPGIRGGGPGQFRRPSDIAVDAQGRAFTSELEESRIQLFRPVPVTSILAGPDGRTGDATPTFELGSDEAGSTFECRIVPAAFGPCSDGDQHTTAPLTDGTYTFEARATYQGATDPTPATRTFTVDTTSPALTVDEPPAGALLLGAPGSPARPASRRATRTR